MAKSKIIKELANKEIFLGILSVIKTKLLKIFIEFR